MSMKRRSRRGDKGAAAVEMAIVLPLLVFLAFGVAEFGWAFAQKMDLNSAAREGARIAAITPGPTDDVKNLLCATLDVNEIAAVVMDVSGADARDSDPAGSQGAIGRFWIEADYDSLTGFFDFLASGVSMRSSVDFRVEIPDLTPTWWSASSGFSC
jgi:hypothetical protein